jgi:hypothetical protein
MVYVVVVVGETWRLPLAATAPMPGSIVTLSALEELQLRVADAPAEILAGDTVTETLTCPGPGTGSTEPPPQPENARKRSPTAGNTEKPNLRPIRKRTCPRSTYICFSIWKPEAHAELQPLNKISHTGTNAGTRRFEVYTRKRARLAPRSGSTKTLITNVS